MRKKLDKIGKSFLSVVLCLTMLLTTFCFFDIGSLISEAVVDVNGLVNTVEPTVKFYVPETIYLNPVIGSGTQKYSFQYFIDCDETGSLRRSATQTSGTVYFSCSSAWSSMSISWENTTITSSATNTSTNQIFKQTITGGTTSVSDGRVKVTCTYVVGGVTYYAYAYTYMYYPDLDLLTGAVGSYVYKTSIGNEPKLAAFSFITGVHYVGNTTTYTDEERGVSNYYDRYNTSSSKGAFGLSPLIPNWSSTAQFKTADDNANVTDRDIIYGETAVGNSKFIVSGNGGVYFRGRQRDGSTEKYIGNSSTSWGVLYVDTSRVNNYNQIPNLRGGFICHYYTNSSDQGKLDTFQSDDGTITIMSNIDYRNGDGKGYGMTSSEALKGTPDNKTYTMRGKYTFERSNSSTVHFYEDFGLQVNTVNKGSLRSVYRDAIESGWQLKTGEYKGWSSSAQSSWTSAYNTLASALDTAGTILGKPYATASEVTSAYNSLNNAKTACDNIISSNFTGGENTDLLNMVKFYVPETIFINRDDGVNFQYIYGVDTNGNAEQGVALSSATNARIYFEGINCNPTSVKITCMGGYSDNNANWTTVNDSALSSITFGGTGFNGSTANSTGKTFTSFPVNTNCSGGAFSSAIGSGNYRFIRWRADYVVDGMTFTTYAYSTCYRQPIYNAYYRHSSRQYVAWNRSPAYINAELFVNGLNVTSVSGSAGTTSSGSGGSGSDNNNSSKTLDTSMIIDTSRFTNYSQLPYLNARYNILNVRTDATMNVYAYNSSNSGVTSGIGTGDTSFNLAIDGSTLVVYMYASALCRGKTAQNYTYINIAPNCINKSAIRTRYYNAVSMCRQQNWYTAGFDEYQNSILDMAIKTGNPVGTSTSGTANTDNLTRYSGTVTAAHRRASNAGADYNGNTGAVIIGTQTETKTYSYGDTVYGYYNEIPGFTKSSYSVTYGSTTKSSGVPQDNSTIIIII